MIDRTQLFNLINSFELSQWKHKANLDLIKNYPIMTRSDLRKIKQKKGIFSSKSSGSTGEPVTVEKTLQDYIWYMATNIRELIWRRWDATKTKAALKGGLSRGELDSWGLPKEIFPIQGKTYVNGYQSSKEIQAWLEEVNPCYLHCFPSIVKQLDISKLTNLIDIKGTGELGGSMYSSEECGTIAIQCPDNKNNYHVMENQIIEVDNDGGIIITTLSNPYIRRYKHGDHVELGTCTCGRSLQTITKIHGRVRNMFVLPDGSKKWPLIGSRTFHDKYGIEKFKCIQWSLKNVELQIIAPKLDESALIKEVKDTLEADVDIQISYVDSFPNYKHEEFVSMVV